MDENAVVIAIIQQLCARISCSICLSLDDLRALLLLLTQLIVLGSHVCLLRSKQPFVRVLNAEREASGNSRSKQITNSRRSHFFVFARASFLSHTETMSYE